MDYVNFCERMLRVADVMMYDYPGREISGMTIRELASRFALSLVQDNQEPQGHEPDAALIETVTRACWDLIDVDLLKGLSQHNDSVLATAKGRMHLKSPERLWERMCTIELEELAENVVVAIAQLSFQSTIDGSKAPHLRCVEGYEVYEALGHPQNPGCHIATIVESALSDLINAKLIRDESPIVRGSYCLIPSYAGAVYVQRRDWTLEARRVRDLVAEGETTTCDLKRELNLKENDQKVEFIKDALALANTQASGRRYLLVGFANEGHYHAAPDPKITEDRLNQILNDYTTPTLQVRYRTIDLPEGRIGEIEVIRERHRVPYEVGKTLRGATKQITEREVKVRHGSLTANADFDEIAAIKREAARARRDMGYE